MKTKKIKVLVLIDAWFPFVGGAQVQIRNLKRILEKKYQVKYFILHSPSSHILARFLWSFWVVPQAVYLNKKHKFDLIHSHAYWPGIPGKILSLLLQIPVVFTVHGSNLLDLGIKSLRAFLEKMILTRIKYDQVISASSSFLKYENVNKNIKVINNGVDVRPFDKVKIKKAKDFKVLFVGRKDPVKGLEFLKRAMVEVKKQIPQARLRIISGGMGGKALIKEYKSSHVFVLPSLSEGQPLTLLEAWAAKLPVIVTRVGENPRMVKNGINGYLVKSKDIKGLARGIIKVLKDGDRDRMGKEGYRLVREKYTWEEVAEKIFKIYSVWVENLGKPSF